MIPFSDLFVGRPSYITCFRTTNYSKNSNRDDCWLGRLCTLL